MAKKDSIHSLNPITHLRKVGAAESPKVFRKKQPIYEQGDVADSIYYIVGGKVKLSVLSKRGKEAVVAILEDGSFFGEGCLAGQNVRMGTASTLNRSTILRIEKKAMLKLLTGQSGYANRFIGYLLTRNMRIEEDLVDQLFNSSEKRLARLLLLLSHYGKDSKPEPVVPNISQETLAMMVGTTRSRVSQFMNKFRKLGLIDYNGKLYVNKALLSAVLRE